MAKYDYDKLTGASLLRADPYFREEENNKAIQISEEQFWGTSVKKGLYYDYNSENNQFGYTYAKEGWSDYSLRDKLNIEQTSRWIKENIFKRNSKLCIIQGYAGCGKTIFVHNILKEVYEKNIFSGYYNFYVGYIDKATEDRFIPASIESKIINQIIRYLREEDGMDIYNKFVDLFKLDLSELNPVFESYFSPIFYSRNDASLYDCAKKIYTNRNTKKGEEYEKDYRSRFKNSYHAKCVLEKTEDNMLEYLLIIDYILRCAVYLIRNSENEQNQIVVYDNLDIIENHKIIVNFIDKLRSVLSNYIFFKDSQKLSLPMFKAIVVVRKITYASISSFSEVENSGINQKLLDVEFLEISNLYIQSNVLTYKAKILKENLDEYIPKTEECYNRIIPFLEEILKIPEEIFIDTKFCELLNHNIRACINMLDEIINSEDYKDYISNQSPAVKLSNRCKTSVWIYIICSILKTKNIWKDLGYNLADSKQYNHPTTLSRLILTYLCNRRQGCENNFPGFISVDVSFKEIVESLKKLPFKSFSKYAKWEDEVCTALEQGYTQSDTQDQIVFYISKMLQRNNSDGNFELWRRPIFYTNNAFALSDIDEIKREMFNQIRNFNKKDESITNFCITDEGYTFIEKFATHFEFYSMRYSKYGTKPMCCESDNKKLHSLINRVYSEVEICAKKQVWLMKFYTKKHCVSKEKYLNEWFHPRTENFMPQLHIVRTIYDHIAYLDIYREELYEKYKTRTDKMDSDRFRKLNDCLIHWIGKYLQLYKSYLYEELIGTAEEYNNNVWLDLMYLYWLIKKDDKRIGVHVQLKNEKDENICIQQKSSSPFIAIGRNDCTVSRQNQENYNENYKISDSELLEIEILDKCHNI